MDEIKINEEKVFVIGFKNLDAEQQETLSATFLQNAKNLGLALERDQNITEQTYSYHLGERVIHDKEEHDFVHSTIRASLEDAVKSVSSTHQVDTDGYGQLYVQDAISNLNM